jgi:mRNA deadenylase 3'-5' endonuclease subunit Ccr4
MPSASGYASGSGSVLASLPPRALLQCKQEDGDAPNQVSASASASTTPSFVMTWNTLARSLCNVTSFPHTTTDALTWDKRVVLLEAELFSPTRPRPSIIALQGEGINSHALASGASLRSLRYSFPPL